MSPSVCMRTKASFTALESLSSMVKHSLVQSRELPRRRSWEQMVLPDCSFHCAQRVAHTSRGPKLKGKTKLDENGITCGLLEEISYDKYQSSTRWDHFRCSLAD